jgi:hypothetical protein
MALPSSGSEIGKNCKGNGRNAMQIYKETDLLI